MPESNEPRRMRSRLMPFAVMLLVTSVLAGGWLARSFMRTAPEPPEIPWLEHLDDELRERIVQLQEEIAQSPRSAGVRAELAMVLHANELPGLAVEVYPQAVSLGADARVIWHFHAMAQEQTGDLEAAVASLDRVLRKRRPLPEAFRRQATWLQNLGRAEEAERILRRGLMRYEDDPALRYTLASVLLDLRRPEEARATILEHDLVNGPNAGSVYRLLAMASLQLDRPEEAEEAMKHASTSSPVWPDGFASELSQRRFGAQRRELAASRLIRDRRYAQAIPLLQEMVRENADDPRGSNLLAVSYLQSGQPDRAVTLLRASAQRFPHHFGTHLNLASALRQIDAPDNAHLREAMVHVERAIAIRPQGADAYELRGSIRARLGDTDQAISDYMTAFELDGRDALRLVRGALLQRDLGRWSEALSNLLKAEARLSDQTSGAQRAVVHLGVAHCLMETGEFTGADERLAAAAALLAADDQRVAALRNRLAVLQMTSSGDD